MFKYVQSGSAGCTVLKIMDLSVCDANNSSCRASSWNLFVEMPSRGHGDGGSALVSSRGLRDAVRAQMSCMITAWLDFTGCLFPCLNAQRSHQVIEASSSWPFQSLSSGSFPPK